MSDAGWRMAGKDSWDKLGTLATIAVPVVLAVIGARWQAANERQQIARDYVEVAVGILSTRPISPQDPLRPWAVKVINHYSEVQLTDEQRTRLQWGEYLRDDGSQAELVFKNLPGPAEPAPIAPQTSKPAGH